MTKKEKEDEDDKKEKVDEVLHCLLEDRQGNESF